MAQIVGGILSGSLALIADALHNFSDMAALVIAFAARKISRRPADERMTFGYGRVEVVAALINYTTLILIGIYLFKHSSLIYFLYYDMLCILKLLSHCSKKCLRSSINIKSSQDTTPQ